MDGLNGSLGYAESYAGKILTIGCVVEALDLTSNFTVGSDRSDRTSLFENHQIFILNNTNGSYCSAESYAGKMLKIRCLVEALDPTSNFALF